MKKSMPQPPAELKARISEYVRRQRANPKMTLRDQFAMHGAAAVIAAVTSNMTGTKEILWSDFAEAGYGFADAMLEAREKKP